MIANHHPRCILRMVAEEGPDRGEALSPFEARLRRVRCTCQDALALELAPKVVEFLRRPITDELRQAIAATVRSYVNGLEISGRMAKAPRYRLDWHSNGVRVIWDRIDDRERSDTDG